MLQQKYNNAGILFADLFLELIIILINKLLDNHRSRDGSGTPQLLHRSEAEVQSEEYKRTARHRAG